MRIYLSKKTTEMIETQIFSVIKEYKEFDDKLIKAIIKIESNFYPFAIRYEPHLKNARWYTKTLTSIDNITDFHFCSFGLMQVLFGVARNLGFEGSPFELFDVKTNIYFGTKLLSNYFKIYNSIQDVISSYNQGSPRKSKDGKYKNQDYVDKVYKYYKAIGGKL